MTLYEIAKIYTDLVIADNAIPEGEHIAKDEIGALRTKYHQILMDQLEKDGVAFADRFEAMHIAFEIVKEGSLGSNERRI